MERREVLRLIPLTIAGLASNPIKVFTQQKCGCPMHSSMLHESLALQYLNKSMEMLQWIRETQSENMLEAAYAIARTVKNNGKCWNCWDVGHSINADMFPGRNGEPEIFTKGYDMAQAQKGDLLLASLYQGKPEGIEDLIKKEIFLIAAPAPWGFDAKGQDLIDATGFQLYSLKPHARIWIETNITTLDAVIQLPGMPAPIGPFSGIFGMVTFWMMMADTARILARDGLSVKVKGDEPPISGGNVKWASLDDPIMDSYFDEVIKQIQMIEGELGNIQKVAKMAVDAVLSGGKVYCYSRYPEALSTEAQTRRGGLALTNGTHEGDRNFKGTSKDVVIMGLSKPDDEIDLKNLDKFRSLGMKVASMGPYTRDMKIPEGRTVPKEADIHVGRMCDTYGLFAVKGFEQKICPTSGAVLNQIFWATCLEIAEQIIQRTGNAPCVFYSGVVKGGIDHLRRMFEIYKERGY